MSEINLDSVFPYSVYGIDIQYPQYYAVKHYLENDYDTIDIKQSLSCLFLDIEVYTERKTTFPQPNIANFPISAITIFFNKTNELISYILKHKNISNEEAFNNITNEHISSRLKEFAPELAEIPKDVKVLKFDNETELIKSCWEQIHKFDPCVLSGFNSDLFDYPYIYNRLIRLIGEEEAKKTVSKFGEVRAIRMKDTEYIDIAEFVICDMLYLYRPRDDGGLGYGSKQASYSLDWIASNEISLKKLQFKETGISLDKFYEINPDLFLVYNIIDVLLLASLDMKLKHLELHNMLRRFMKTPLQLSLKGFSATFDTLVYYKLKEQGLEIRFGVGEETEISISEEEVNRLPKPKSLVKKWTVKSVDKNTSKAILNRYPGAFVKDPKPSIITSKEGLIIDMDASSLYPSMILQNNISFDSFYGRIIDPTVYKTIKYIENIIRTKSKVDDSVYNKTLVDFCIKYVDDLKPQNKTEYKQYLFLILSHLLKSIEEYPKNDINKLYNPELFEDYLFLINKYIPFIELMEEIHPDATKYNSFAYELIVNGEIKNPNEELYIIEDIQTTKVKIKRIQRKDFRQYIKDNELIVTITGCLFYKHDKKPGLFVPFLKELRDLRKKYKKLRDQHDPQSEEYKFYDMRQSTTKIVMNTTYGLYGLTRGRYRWGSKWLAKTITQQGQLILKLSQAVCEEYFKKKKTKL